MDWAHEHPLLTAGLVVGIALGGLGIYGYRKFDRWRRKLNLKLERHR